MRDKKAAMKDLGRVCRRKIVIQQYSEKKNEWGDPIGAGWDDWKTVWAERSSLWGRDYYAALAVGEEQTVEFVVRYVAFLDELKTDTHRLLYDGEIYDIKHIDYLKDDGMWLKIRAVRRA